MKRFLGLLLAFCVLFIPSATAAVAVNGIQSALIGEEGVERVAPGAYAHITALNDEGTLFAATVGNGYALMDAYGNLLTEDSYSYFEMSGDLILFEKDGKYGIFDRNLNVRVSNEYTWLIPNGNGGFLALRTDVWDDSPDGVYLIDETGYISPTGIKVAALPSAFSDGFAAALSTDKGRYGYLNAKGQWGIQPQFIYAETFENGIASVTMDSGSGLIDLNGTWKIPPRYDMPLVVDAEHERIAGIRHGHGVDVYDPQDFRLLYTIPCQNENAYFTVEGGCVFLYESDALTVYSQNGEEMFRLSASAGISTSDGVFFALSDGGWGEYASCILDKNGTRLTDCYQDLEYLCTYEGIPLYIVRQFEESGDGVWNPDSVRCGVIDAFGRGILPIAYTFICDIDGKWMMTETDDTMQLCRLDGTVVWSYTEE